MARFRWLLKTEVVHCMWTWIKNLGGLRSRTLLSYDAR